MATERKAFGMKILLMPCAHFTFIVQHLHSLIWTGLPIDLDTAENWGEHVSMIFVVVVVVWIENANS